MIIGFAHGLPNALASGLIAHDVPAATANHVAHLPPVSTLFAAFLGYNPVSTLLGAHALAGLPHAQATLLTGHSFFPRLISKPFAGALTAAFSFAAAACLIAAVASLLRGRRFTWGDDD